MRTINEGPQRVNPSVDLREAVATTSEKIAKLRNNHLLMNESTYRTQLKVPNSCEFEQMKKNLFSLFSC